MTIMTMPGVPVCYYGDEIGMENAELKDEDIRDSFALRTTKVSICNFLYKLFLNY